MSSGKRVLDFSTVIFAPPLRGHGDGANIESSNNIFDLPDPRFGCFNGLLHLMMDAGDRALSEHLDESPRNAIYGTPLMQNRILDLMREYMQAEIITEARNSEFYSVLVDTTQDEGRIDQMSLVLRYITADNDIIEQFLEYVDVSNSTTGEKEDLCTMYQLVYSLQTVVIIVRSAHKN